MVFFQNELNYGTKMKIATIGWGSLIWDQERQFNVKGVWADDGPTLPLEFCRISSRGKEKERVTLVIDQISGMACPTYWNYMHDTTLELAINTLRIREETPQRNIHYILKNGIPMNDIQVTIHNWLRNRDIDAMIWTGLSSNWEECRNTNFSLDDLEAYLLSKKSTFNFIDEYFEKAPTQIKTPGRELFNKIKLRILQEKTITVENN